MNKFLVSMNPKNMKHSVHRLLFSLLTACIATIGASAQQFPPFPRPYGIYAIGQTSVTGIRDYPFVDGFVMRIDWSLLEPQKDLYDFSAIDAVVGRLDSLGQTLTLDVFRMAVPDYIMATPGVLAHTLQLNQKTFETVVPWDPYALERFDKLSAALSDHAVFNLMSKSMIPFRNHPVLKQIDATPLGTNGIRDINHSLTTHPTYSRKVFVRSIVHTAEIVRRYFPDTFTFVAMFGITDSVMTPPLTNVIRDSLLRGINRGSSRPMLGFFQENLSCNGPTANQSNVLYALRDSTFTMYQMLQGWRTPFLDPTKTDTCKTDSTGPDVAMLKALAVTHCLYFEIYASDLDWPGYRNMFTAMSDSLRSIHSTLTTAPLSGESPSLEKIELFQNFPNPFSGRTTIRFTLGDATRVSLRVYDLLGREVAVLVDEILAAGSHMAVFDLRSQAIPIKNGLYFCRLVTPTVSIGRFMIAQH
jgi:hypothetical protein